MIELLVLLTLANGAEKVDPTPRFYDTYQQCLSGSENLVVELISTGKYSQVETVCVWDEEQET